MISKQEVFKYLNHMKGTEKKMEKEYAYLSRRVKNLSLKKQLLAMSKEEIQHYKLIVNLEKLLK